MRNLQFTGQLYGRTVTLQQISKPAARKLYDAGEEIMLCPSNFRPLNRWFQGSVFEQSTAHPIPFESILNNFSHHNRQFGRTIYYKIINH
jgi:hypothetical protein